VPFVDVEIVRAPAPPTPAAAERVVLDFERLATNKDVDVAKLERLIAMQKDILAHEARAAFNRAFASMQSEIPSIVERSQGDGGKWSYAPLEDIQTIVRPILERHGFGLSFRTEWPDRQIKVIGILTHRDGHERTSEFLAEADTSGSKNAIQARGSAVAYGRRYTTKDLLNITTRGADTDGVAPRPVAMETPKAPTTHPAGYLAWLDTLRQTAMLGTAALERAWYEAPKAFRQHLTTANPRLREELKAIAARQIGAVAS
jgi:hypothetical protein